MLEVKAPSDPTVVVTAGRLAPFPLTGTYPAYIGRDADLVLHQLTNALCFEAAMGLSEALGYPTQLTSRDVHFRGSAPHNFPYRRDFDDFAYGSHLGTIATGLYLLQFPRKVGIGMPGENPVIHSGYKGNASWYASEYDRHMFYPSTEGTTIGGKFFPTIDLTYRPMVNRFTFDGSGFYTGHIREEWWSTLQAYSFLNSTLDVLRDVPITWHHVAMDGITEEIYTLNSFDYVYTLNSCEIQYTGSYKRWRTNDGPPSSYWAEYDFSCRLTLERYEAFYFNDFLTFGGTFRSKNPGVKNRFSWTITGRRRGTSLHDYSEAYVPGASGMCSVPIVDASFLSLPTVGSNWPASDDTGPLILTTLPKANHGKFAYAIKRDILNLLPIHFYSTAEAVEKYTSVLEANNLENLLQAGAIASILPDIGLFVQIIRDTKNLKLLKAGRSIIDLWSDIQLKWDFGAKPLLSDVREVSEKYDSVRNRLNGMGLYGPKVVYGKFIYHLPEGTYGRDRVTVIARSKVRMNLSDSTLLTAYLRGKAIGMLPTLSALWDLVPLSFVADWFFNLSERFSDIDNQALLMLIPTTHCLHSLEIISDFSESELEDYSLLSAFNLGDKGAPGLRYYARFLSRRMPTLKESIYDFRAAHGPTSLATAGAFLWKVIT